MNLTDQTQDILSKLQVNWIKQKRIFDGQPENGWANHNKSAVSLTHLVYTNLENQEYSWNFQDFSRMDLPPELLVLIGTMYFRSIAVKYHTYFWQTLNSRIKVRGHTYFRQPWKSRLFLKLSYFFNFQQWIYLLSS